MDQSAVFLFLCVAAAGLFLLWVFLLKRQARIRRERKIQRQVDNQLAYEQRLDEERKRRGNA